MNSQSDSSSQTQHQNFDHDKLKSNLSNQRNWTRLVYMLIFGLVLHVCGAIMWAVCVVQFLFVLLTGQDNANLRRFGSSLSNYIHQALQFVSYNSEHKPFPFTSWDETQARYNNQQGQSYRKGTSQGEWQKADTQPDRSTHGEGEVIDVTADPVDSSEHNTTREQFDSEAQNNTNPSDQPNAEESNKGKPEH